MGAISKIWYNQHSRGIIFQIIALVLILGFISLLVHNLLANYAIQSKSFGFDFLGQPAGYDISESMSLIDFQSTDTHLRAAVVGLLGTLHIAIWGIITTTILGLIVGIARLSKNYIINRLAYFYVETIRNIPLLLQILFWSGLFSNILPSPRESITWGDNIYINNSGFNLPKPLFNGMGLIILASIIVAIIIAFILRKYAMNQLLNHGKKIPLFWINTAVIIGIPLVVFVALGAPLEFENPTLGRFRLTGGIYVPAAFIAMWVSLSLYTASFIAEIVRAGILSVSHGQTEAAMALGIKRSWMMRLILIPQALRVIVPPMTSQYLNLTKNSSLAIAVGYVDITLTLGGSTLNITGHEMECMMLVMLFYLTISLAISSLMNYYNKKIAIKER